MEENKKQSADKRKRAMLGRVRRKSEVAFLIVLALMAVLSIRVFIINYSKGDEYSKTVLNHQIYTSTTLPYRRGQIMDRNGTVLAYSEKVYSIIFDPAVVGADENYIEPTITALTTCFPEIKESDLRDLITNRSHSNYEKLLSELTEDQIKSLRSIIENTKDNPYVKGIWFEEGYKRQYPFNTLAADVIGFASAANGGELGLESYYDDELTGTNGSSYNYIDSNMDVTDTSREAQDGNNLITTIDYGMQAIVEDEIRKYNAGAPSKNTAVIIMNPSNGEVLSMASYPEFNLNNPRDLTSLYSVDEINAMTDEEYTNALYKLWNNYCTSEVFEPGSTFKPFTVAGALEEGVVRDGDVFSCNGFMEIGGYEINCWTRATKGGHGSVTLAESLSESCNPALIQIAQKLGSEKLVKYHMLFGFGSKIGIDLPGEERGILKDYKTMDATDLATNSFGQNLNVTMIQMCAAYSSLINGGNYYKPHILKSITDSDGNVVKTVDKTLVRQTVTKETSDLVKSYLEYTVENGTATGAKVTGYSIGGKTGTAQKLPRSAKTWLNTFTGFAPVDNPQLLIYVLIDEPAGSEGTAGSSGDVVGLSQLILQRILPYSGIYKDTTAVASDVAENAEESVELPNTGGEITSEGSSENTTEKVIEKATESSTESTTESTTESVTESTTENEEIKTSAEAE